MRRATTSLILALLLLAPPAPARSQEEPPQADSEAEGENVEIPWQAQIYSGSSDWKPEELAVREGWDLAHKCGGTLIAENWVLTAAHCINAARIANGHRVRLGASSITGEDGISYRIARMVRHADYNATTKAFDIALVHLVADERTISGNAGAIEPLALYEGPPLEPGVPLFSSGWGKLEAKGAGYQPELSWVDLQTTDCADDPQAARFATDHQLCAVGLTPDDDTCEGDSGGPLVMRGDTPLLVGVVNYGFGCYREGTPGVYLRIDRDHFRDWIDRAMAVDPSVSELR